MNSKNKSLQNGLFGAISGATTGVLLAISGLILVSSRGCLNSEQYLRTKELEKECIYITPDSGKKIGYKLEDGRIATIGYLDGGIFGKDRLEISLDSVSFRSKGISPEDAWVLETLLIKNNGRFERFTRENIENYSSWATEYEKLIDEIAERRAKFEENNLYQIKYR